VAVYLDASAAVKLLVEEAETEALRTHLRIKPVRASSELLAVELVCVAYRLGIPAVDAERLAGTLILLPLDSRVLARARRPYEPPQRALDAIHLATAELSSEAVDEFVTYDQQQGRAAIDIGLSVVGPA